MRLFVLTAGQITASEMGRIFVKALKKMERLAIKHDEPFIARVTRAGNVSRYDLED